MLKKLAIVGRPNVGKSALFNRIAQRRIAIVDAVEGVTRDRLSVDVFAAGFYFQLIDTGGFDPTSKDGFKEKIIEQAKAAIEEADTLVMVVDGKIGVTPIDEKLATLLHKTGKPLSLAVNKVDTPLEEHRIHDFHKLGIKKVMAVSASHGYQIEELLEMAWQGALSPLSTQEDEKKSPTSRLTIRLAIIGQPNVGKSTLVNALFGQERVVVSDIAGTTRDAIDIPLTKNGTHYILVDTAGIKRRKAEKDPIEKFAFLRSKEAIENSDIALLVLDAKKGLGEQEKRIIQLVEEAGKGCLLLFNKWDTVSGYRMEHCAKAVRLVSPFLETVPLLFISAQSGRNLEMIFQEVEKLHKSLSTRLTTHQLNKFLIQAQQLNHPPMLKGKRLRIYYATQVSTHPPTFILFVNHANLMNETYKKYLINQFRKTFGFSGVPLRFYLKGKHGARSGSSPPDLQASNAYPPDSQAPDA